MAIAVKPLASLGSVGKSTAVSATVAKEKRSSVKQFSAAANDILQKPSLRVAPRTVQMQKGAIQDKGNPHKPGAKPFSPQTLIGSFKKGGKVKKTGIYKLHKGERVLNKEQVQMAEDRVNMESPMARILSKEN
jgi:hypothetical protein